MKTKVEKKCNRTPRVGQVFFVWPGPALRVVQSRTNTWVDRRQGPYSRYETTQTTQ